MEIAKNGLREL